MKVLKHLTSLWLIFNSLLFAQSTTLENYISNNKKDQFRYSYDKNEAEGSKLRDSWISPLHINYNLSKSKPFTEEQTNQSASIKLDQPIFRSGGIYFGIKFANASKLYADYSIDVAKRKMIKDTINILMQIKQTSLRIKSQNLRIENAKINLSRKKEQYLNGQLDSGFLDDAIIQQNQIIQTLYDMQTTKEKLITQFETLSDYSYKTIDLPHLETIDNQTFLQNNIVIQQTEAEVNKNKLYKNITIAKYLPSIGFTAGYNWQKSENRQFTPGMPGFTNENSYYDYGLRVSMPIDVNVIRDIQSTKVDYLKSQVLAKDKKRGLRALYKQVTHSITNYDKKIKLSDENIKIYKKLLSDTIILFNSGYKTQEDVSTLENSLNIQRLQTNIYELDKQMELLTLYEMYVSSNH